MVLEHLKLLFAGRVSVNAKIFLKPAFEKPAFEKSIKLLHKTIYNKMQFMHTNAYHEMCTELQPFVYCHRRFAARWKWPQFIPRSLIKLDLGYREDARFNILKTLTVKRFLSKAALVHPDHDFPTSLSHGLLLLLRITNACVSVSVLWGFLFCCGVYNDLLR